MRLLTLLLLSVICWSCKEKKGYTEKNENNGDPVYTIESDDKEMNRAVQQAKDTYADFLAALNQQDSSNKSFAVKMRFAYDEASAEHLWLADLHKKAGKLFGVVDSDPYNVTWIKWGDTLEIKKDSLSDWMYLRNGKMVGGYTTIALYHKMSEKEKKEFRDEVDFEIE